MAKAVRQLITAHQIMADALRSVPTLDPVLVVVDAIPVTQHQVLCAILLTCVLLIMEAAGKYVHTLARDNLPVRAMLDTSCLALHVL